ncbi:TIGR03618 family F420-dependent PPOX class oxidoreductase [Phytomonospora sp. NPDC050363]|uniref:TIGR03618 family F420-dependent PPOX class oxidoreductase n=1 Tax=Phytomonospora sp. NPDC050363 TaxID=3155642 RepID=UPI00340FDC11
MRPLPRTAADFLAESRVAAFTTLRPDGSPHTAPVRFTWDGVARVARILTVGGSRKVANLRRNGRVGLCQVDGFRWLTLEGTATVTSDAGRVADAAARYARRYGSAPPAPPGRVLIEIAVDRTMSLNT